MIKSHLLYRHIYALFRLLFQSRRLRFASLTLPSLRFANRTPRCTVKWILYKNRANRNGFADYVSPRTMPARVLFACLPSYGFRQDFQPFLDVRCDRLGTPLCFRVLFRVNFPLQRPGRHCRPFPTQWRRARFPRRYQFRLQTAKDFRLRPAGKRLHRRQFQRNAVPPSLCKIGPQ